MSCHKETICSITALLISAFLTVQSFQYPAESSHFPRFLTILMTFLSVMMVFRNWKSQNTDNSSGFKSTELKTLFIVVTLTILYVLGIYYIGYFVSTTLFLVIMMRSFGHPKPFAMALAVFIFLATVYVLFVVFLGMHLPKALLI